MAKKPKKEAVKPDESKGTLAKKKYLVEKAAKKAARAAGRSAEAVPEHAVPPAVPAVKKPKRPRFVREQKAEQPQPKTASLPPRSTKAHAKLMSKGLALPPKEDKGTGPMPMGP